MGSYDTEMFSEDVLRITGQLTLESVGDYWQSCNGKMSAKGEVKEVMIESRSFCCEKGGYSGAHRAMSIGSRSNHCRFVHPSGFCGLTTTNSPCLRLDVWPSLDIMFIAE